MTNGKDVTDPNDHVSNLVNEIASLERVVEQERWYSRALFQLLKEARGVPNSTELIEAHARALAD